MILYDLEVELSFIFSGAFGYDNSIIAESPSFIRNYCSRHWIRIWRLYWRDSFCVIVLSPSFSCLVVKDRLLFGFGLLIIRRPLTPFPFGISFLVIIIFSIYILFLFFWLFLHLLLLLFIVLEILLLPLFFIDEISYL